MNEKIYRIVSPDGKIETVALEQKADLNQLQEWVGGYIEVLQILPKQWIVVNEMGKINGMPVNPLFIYRQAPLYGPIVVLPKGCAV